MIARKSKILLIGPTPPPVHGVARAFEILLNSGLKRNFDVVHLDLADRRGIEHVNAPDFHDLLLFARQFIKLGLLCLKHRPSVSYLAISQTTVGFTRDSFFILLSRVFSSRIVLHLHSGNFKNWYHASSFLTRAYVRFILKQVDLTIVLGESLKPQFEGLVDYRKLAVVPNGIPWKKANASSARSFPKNGKIRVLHLSTLSRLKGALTLLEAIPLVLREFEEIEFIFSGNWYRREDQQAAESILAKEKFGNQVFFTGEVTGDDKIALIESADIFVFPGIQQEGQPLVVIEAMAAGLPIIYTDRGCLRETVINGVNGLEIERNSCRDLSEKIVWLVSHADQRKEMGRESRKRYEILYTDIQFEWNMVKVFQNQSDPV